MAQWGKSNVTSNSVLWAPAQFNKAPNTVNRDLLFGNTTADGLRTGQTIGLSPVSDTVVANVGTISGATVVLSGTGATARPNISITDPTGSGSGATATANLGLVSASANNTGTGASYVPGDVLTISGGTGTSATINVVSTAVRTAAINATALSTGRNASRSSTWV